MYSNINMEAVASAKLLLIGIDKRDIEKLVELGYTRETITHIDSFYRAKKFFDMKGDRKNLDAYDAVFINENHGYSQLSSIAYDRFSEYFYNGPHNLSVIKYVETDEAGRRVATKNIMGSLVTDYSTMHECYDQYRTYITVSAGEKGLSKAKTYSTEEINEALRVPKSEIPKDEKDVRFNELNSENYYCMYNEDLENCDIIVLDNNKGFTASNVIDNVKSRIQDNAKDLILFVDYDKERQRVMYQFISANPDFNSRLAGVSFNSFDEGPHNVITMNNILKACKGEYEAKLAQLGLKDKRTWGMPTFAEFRASQAQRKERIKEIIRQQKTLSIKGPGEEKVLEVRNDLAVTTKDLCGKFRYVFIETTKGNGEKIDFGESVTISDIYLDHASISSEDKPNLRIKTSAGVFEVHKNAETEALYIKLEKDFPFELNLEAAPANIVFTKVR